MRRKILLIACLAALVLTVGVFDVARGVLVRSFSDIETDAARQSIERVIKAVEADLRQLDVTALDYAQWDDMYEFARGNRPDLIRHNFTQTTFDNLHVDVVWIVDNEGRTLASVGSRRGLGSRTSALGSDVLGQLAKYRPHLIGDGEHSTRGPRFLRTALGPLAYSAARILPSDQSAPAAGILIFGRYTQPADVERLREMSQLPVQITVLEESARPFGRFPLPVQGWLDSGAGSPDDPYFIVDDGASLRGYSLLRDVEGAPLAMLSTDVSRAAFQIGKRTIMAVILALLAGFAAVVVVLLSIINRSWRTRDAIKRQRREDQRQLSKLAQRDPLTGLPNRAYVQRRLPRLMARAERSKSMLALLYIDLDHFKNVNDSLGHGAGDRFLAATAQRLRASVANHDLVARMGGDEFVVVAGDLPDIHAVESMARRIQKTLSAPLDVDGVSLSVAPSIGISLCPDDGVDPEQLLKHADIALYQAKDGGRATHQFFAAEMNARLREKLGMERALRQALQAQELFIEYQPSFDLTTLRPISFEALLRWRTADGLIPPTRFIPLAEQSELIVEIGDWVLRRVCQQLAEWQEQRVPLLPVSINLSVRQFERSRIAENVTALTREYGVDANLLHFEITEGTAMQNSGQHLAALQALRKLGSRILIDDFGTGYSSLSYLKHLPIDTLKIDRAFVREMDIDSNDVAIVGAIIGIARSLGLHLVAEGVESADQLNCLREMGCEAAQGYYFSPPTSPEKCRVLLEKLRMQRSPLETQKLLVLRSMS